MSSNKKIMATLFVLMIGVSLTFVNITSSARAYVTQTSWYWKPAYPDYAPSGVPDFDQRQNAWQNFGKWTWCGPLAVANSLWWFDSKFEPSPVPPPTINDGFPLVTAYGAWDDHDPLNVEPFAKDLAWLMDTDGQRTSSMHSGTKVSDMEVGIRKYLANKGLDQMFYVKTVPMPTFEFIEEQVEESEDVVILLGFWQEQPPGSENWVRVGGHFVTVPGVNSADFTIAFSDPIKDNAELGFPGRVIPPPSHPHNPMPPFPLHNNASYVSHDFYGFGPTLSPGGSWGPENYTIEDIIDNFSGQNIPEEFEEETGPYDPIFPVSVEVEYTVIVSPTHDVAITNKILGKTVVAQNYTMPVNVTVANEGGFTETFNVTTYYNGTVFSEDFENGTFAGWDFYYSTNHAQNGTIYYLGNPVAEWNSSIVSGASALSGSYSARLLADFWQHTYTAGPWRVDAAINRTIRRNCATVLKATLKFDQITDPGVGRGHAFLYIYVMNALNPSEFISYGFDNSTSRTPGDISFNVSPGDLVNFEADVAADYFNKYGKALPEEVMIRFWVTADYNEDVPARQTVEVRLDDIAMVVPSTPIETKTVTLTSGSSTVITFTWNTTGVCKGNYTISAVADTVPGETDIGDNTYINGEVYVGIPGDIDGDGDVDRYDFSVFAGAYGSCEGDPNYVPEADLNSDGCVDRYDFGIFAGNYGKIDP